ARKSMRTRTHGIARKIAALGAAKYGRLQRICKLPAGRLLRLAVIGARLRYLAGIVSHEALRRLQRCSLLKLWKSPKAPKADGRWHSLAFYVNGAELGRSLVMPPGVPADRVKVLRAAFRAMIEDPELPAEIAKSG